MFEAFESKPTSLIGYQSRGRVVIIGDEASLVQCSELSDPLSVTLIVTNLTASTTLKGAIMLDQRTLNIEGHLGSFQVHLTGADGRVETLKADMVLDLNPQALIALEIPPPGYLHESLDELNLEALQNALTDLTGEFEKPKYFSYNPSICAHGVNGITVCTNCIDACPAGAISSLTETIEVDPYLCQGGGACATVCPSGAIQYVYPRLVDSGNALRKMLAAYRQQGGNQARVVFHAELEFPEDLFQDNDSILPIKVEELASVGADLCLSALVYGASQVVLLSSDETPPTALAQVRHQIEWLAPLLSAVGLNSGQIAVQHIDEDFVSIENKTELEAAVYTMPDNKRNAIFQALDHLYQHAEKSQDEESLPAGAPFGSALVDEKSCTLCMACVGACPGKALQDGSNREMPEIFFIESQCLQCGACVETCPEAAISHLPKNDT